MTIMNRWRTKCTPRRMRWLWRTLMGWGDADESRRQVLKCPGSDLSSSTARHEMQYTLSVSFAGDWLLVEFVQKSESVSDKMSLCNTNRTLTDYAYNRASNDWVSVREVQCKLTKTDTSWAWNNIGNTELIVANEVQTVLSRETY